MKDIEFCFLFLLRHLPSLQLLITLARADDDVVVANSLQQPKVPSGRTPLNICPSHCKCPTSGQIVCNHLSASDIDDVFRTELTSRTEVALYLKITNSHVKGLSTLPSMANLQTLDASHNDIDAIFTYGLFPLVTHLNLANNYIATLRRDEFATFPNVKTLDLSHNKIISIDWETFRLFGLETLILRGNQLTVISEHLFRFTPSLAFLDLSANRLTRVQTSNFCFSQKLAHVDLSRNRITHLDYDSFSPLYHLHFLDLSFNNFTAVPGVELKQLVGLKALNFSGNPIAVLRHGDFSASDLTAITVTESHRLRLITAGAFSHLRYLKAVNLSSNSKLAAISPHAFEHSQVEDIDLTNSELETVPGPILALHTLATLRLGGNHQLECGCVAEAVQSSNSDAETIIAKLADIQQTRCKGDDGARRNLLDALQDGPGSGSQSCRPEPLVPLGSEIRAQLGSELMLYCLARTHTDQLEWTLPNSVVMATNARDATDKLAVGSLDPLHREFFDRPWTVLGASRVDATGSERKEELRVTATNEQLHISTVLSEDAGAYQCAVSRDNYLSKRTIKVIVVRPTVHLTAVEVGSHYATLAWNASLRVASRSVHLFILIRSDLSGSGSDFPSSSSGQNRTVQLNPYSPWLSYNVLRLRPNTNYTFCLTYVYNLTHTLLQSCVDARTQAPLSIFSAVNLSFLLLVCLIGMLAAFVCSIRWLHRRFYIWQDAKYRSRINQSISGQSFLSSNESVVSSAHSAHPRSILTYENNIPMSVSAYSNASSNNNTMAARCVSARLSLGNSCDMSLTTRDMAL